MDDRKAQVLRAVVESFIDTAQPVGSNAVADLAALDVSAATIRNDMAALEAEGYLTQPHTSAGRVPTEAGYRYFVDSLEAGRLEGRQRRVVRNFFQHAQGEIEQRLQDTTRLLSDLTHYAAVVVGPATDPADVRAVQLVDLDGARVLAVLVLASGTVERRSVELTGPPSAAALEAAARVLTDAMVGQPLGAHRTPAASGDADVDALVAQVTGTVADDAASESLYIGGAANMAAHFDAIATVRQVLEVLEEQLVVVTLLQSLVDRGLSVAIGSETGMEVLADCAVVVAPYQVDGSHAGTIGLLGPTRMDYPRALATVDLVSGRLGASLGTGNED